MLAGSTKPVPFLLEIESYPESDMLAQIKDDL
jgi:hypothetical protein